MIFIPTRIPGVSVIDIEPKHDERGFFARIFCAKEFETHGIKMITAQCNVSVNHKKGTIRGMHYQKAPAAETKLVRCIRGAIYDVIVDLRPSSPTYKSSIAIELTAENHRSVYIPEMCAHGFQTLTDDAEVFYQMGEFYRPDYQCGARYDDPAFGIKWPLPISVISARDATWPLLSRGNSATCGQDRLL